MAIRISNSGSTIVFTNTETSETQPYQKRYVEARYTTDNKVYFVHQLSESAKFPFDNTGTTTFEYSDCQDGNGTTFESLQDLKDYISLVLLGIDLNQNDQVALGRVPFASTWNKFGFNEDIDSSSGEVVASFGGVYVPPTTADTIDIVSDSVQDDASPATGCQSIVIYGIDENREEQIEVVSMDGTSTVTTSSQWLGINRVAPFLCGSSQGNVGTITITHTTSGNTLAEMPAALSVTQQAIFHVQVGHTFLASWLWLNVRKLSGGSAPRVTIKGWVFSPVANSYIEIFESRIDTAVENTVELRPTEPFPITEKSVLFFTCETDTNNTAVSVRFSGKEVKNV